MWGNYSGRQLTPLVHVLFRIAVRVFLQFVVMFGRQHGFGEGLHGEHEKDENALLMELDKGLFVLFRYSNVMSHFLSRNQPIIAQKPSTAYRGTTLSTAIQVFSCFTTLKQHNAVLCVSVQGTVTLNNTGVFC